jgi:hypothetical protein
MAKNTIKIKNYSDVFEEINAGGAITPGMLIEEGSAGTVIAHNSAGENALPMFAVEDELQGNGINDAYASGDPVSVWIPGRGDQVYAILADGENVAVGDLLESNGDGYLKKHVAGSAGVVEYPLAVVGYALEAVDLSGSSGEESSGALGYAKRIIVRIV